MHLCLTLGLFCHTHLRHGMQHGPPIGARAALLSDLCVDRACGGWYPTSWPQHLPSSKVSECLTDTPMQLRPHHAAGSARSARVSEKRRRHGVDECARVLRCAARAAAPALTTTSHRQRN